MEENDFKDDGMLFLHVDETAQYVRATDDIVPGAGEQRHSLLGGSTLKASTASIQEQWSKAIGSAVDTASKAINKSPLGYELTELEISFAVGTDGLLGLIVGAKAEGAVRLKFTPQKSDSA